MRKGREKGGQRLARGGKGVGEMETYVIVPKIKKKRKEGS